MLGEKSFHLIESQTHVRGIYYPEVMKKWKALVGFSGTISDSI
jgi:hypothetical protein